MVEMGWDLIKNITVDEVASNFGTHYIVSHNYFNNINSCCQTANNKLRRPI
jgi:hypothetical protein